jgi:phosphinothricin acetyltransferase
MEAGDADADAAIYNEGIRGRGATLQTVDRTASDVAPWAAQRDRFPVVVAERDGAVVGWARAGQYSDFEPYWGVGEVAIYVTAGARGTGVGRSLLDGLGEMARERGFWKLLAKVFPRNETSVGLFHACGYRDVGLHLRHGELEGEWLDVLVLERSL